MKTAIQIKNRNLFIAGLLLVLLVGVSPAEFLAQAQTAPGISGVKFNDLDGDGVKDLNEYGLSGRTVYVDYNKNGALDSAEPSATTDNLGAYTISGINIGTHRLRETTPAGWTCTYPNLSTDLTNKPVVSSACWYDKTFTSSSVLTGIDFGNRTTTPDPVADYLEWPDDEIFLSAPSASGDELYLGAADANLLGFTTLDSNPTGNDATHDRAAAAGRMLDPKRESVAVARAAAQNVYVKFFRPSTSQNLVSYNDMFSARNGCSAFMDIASGDLDNATNAGYDYRDELVLVYAVNSADNHLPIRISVMDFSDASETSPQPLAVTTVLAPGKIDASGIISGTWKCGDNALALDVGDFDADGVDEIAVAYQLNTSDLEIDLYKYTISYDGTGQKSYSLQLHSSYVERAVPQPGFVWTNFVGIDLVAADIDGDGRDEQNIAYVGLNPTTPNFTDINIYSYALPKRPEQYFEFVGAMGDEIPTPSVPPRVQLVAGYFGRPANYEADATDLNLRAKQLAVAYNTDPTHYNIQAYAYKSGKASFWDSDVTYSANFEGEQFSIAAGGFKGLRTPTDQYWTLAATAWKKVGTSYTYSMQYLHPNAPGALAPHGSWSVAAAAPADTYPRQYPVIAVDTDGDSIFLGPPTLIVVEGLQDVKLILQEPPKHAYWNKWAPVPTVETLNRYYDFNISLNQTENIEFKSTTTKGSDWNTGGSLYGSADINTKIGPPLCKVEVGVKASASIGYDYSNSESSYDSSQVGHEWSFKTATNGDDAIAYTSTYYEIWRYPVYGLQEVDPLGNPIYTYYDILIPGSAWSVPVIGAGKDIAGWEPAWENGNILSYPILTSDLYIPPDIGSYFIPCAPLEAGCNKVSDNPPTYQKEIKTPMAWGGYTTAPLNTEMQLAVNQGEGSGSTQTYKNSVTSNADVSGYVAWGNAFFGKSKVEAGITFHGNASWSDSTTEDSTTSTSRTLWLKSPANTGSTQSYMYYPVLYITRDGVVKLTYGVNPWGSDTGKYFWTRTYGDDSPYGAKPDPALNLPNRFAPTFSSNGVQNGWEPETFYTRERIRGFWVKQGALDPNLGDYPLLSHTPVAGEPVRLDVRVYNYSLASGVYNPISKTGGIVNQMSVYFYATSINPTTNEVITVPIGTSLVYNLAPFEPQIASINWTPPASSVPGNHKWQVHVVLDPDNEISEIYDSTDPAIYPCAEPDCVPATNIDPGQNNHGYREVIVYTSDGVSHPHGYLPKDINLKSDALMARNRNGKLDSGTTQAYLFKSLPIQIHVSSDADSLYPREVLLYDGDPAEGGVLIARQMIYPASLLSDGNVEWVTWTPMTIGPHLLYAVLKEPSDDLFPGNNIAMLRVVVIKEPRTRNK